MSTPFGKTTSKAQDAASDYLTREHECVRCGVSFTELNNMGRWLCRMYHPCAHQYDSEGRLICCRNLPGAPGCVRADHTARGDSFVARQGERLNKVELAFDDPMLMASLANTTIQSVVQSQSWQRTDKTWVVSRVCEQDNRRVLNQANEVDFSR